MAAYNTWVTTLRTVPIEPAGMLNLCQFNSTYPYPHSMYQFSYDSTAPTTDKTMSHGKSCDSPYVLTGSEKGCENTMTSIDLE